MRDGGIIGLAQPKLSCGLKGLANAVVLWHNGTNTFLCSTSGMLPQDHFFNPSEAHFF